MPRLVIAIYFETTIVGKKIFADDFTIRHSDIKTMKCIQLTIEEEQESCNNYHRVT